MTAFDFRAPAVTMRDCIDRACLMSPSTMVERFKAVAAIHNAYSARQEAPRSARDFAFELYQDAVAMAGDLALTGELGTLGNAAQTMAFQEACTFLMIPSDYKRDIAARGYSN